MDMVAEALCEIHTSAEWDRALQSFHFIPPGQTASWSEGRYSGDHRIRRFISAKPGAIAVQGILKQSLGVSRFIAEDGPILGDACDEQTVSAFVLALRQRLGGTCLASFSNVQPHDPVLELWLRKAGLRRPWATILSPLTLYVDCSDASRFENGFTRDWRQNIRRGKKKGLTFEVGELADSSARADLLRIYSETYRIKRAVEQLDVSMLRALARDVRWRLFFGSHAGGRVSARLIFISGRTAFDFVAGATAYGRQISASHFLAASILRHLAESGVEAFDFGRIGPGRYDSVDYFKRGSGGRPVAYLGEWTLNSRPWFEFAFAGGGYLRRRERW